MMCEWDLISIYKLQPKPLSCSFKRGLYLAQGVQVAYLLGLVVAVAICVRERIWMRESRNSMVSGGP